MMISEKRLPKTECYPCTRRGAKSAFDGLEVNWISFGSPNKHFRFDRRATHRPRIGGVVVASVSYSTQRESYVLFYVVRRTEYPAEAREDFLARVLPMMRHWLERQIGKPDTAILGFKKMLVAWDGTTHRFHDITL